MSGRGPDALFGGQFSFSQERALEGLISPSGRRERTRRDAKGIEPPDAAPQGSVVVFSTVERLQVARRRWERAATVLAAAGHAKPRTNRLLTSDALREAGSPTQSGRVAKRVHTQIVRPSRPRSQGVNLRDDPG